MCLAVPGQIIALLDKKQAMVDFMGVQKKVAIDLLEECTEGDYVIVHAGFAINKLKEEEALETIRYFKQIADHS